MAHQISKTNIRFESTSTVRTLSDSLATIPDLSDHIVKSNDLSCGGGSFSDVYKRQCDIGAGLTEVAIKSFRFLFMLHETASDDSKSAATRKMLRRELGIWKRLKHPNIVPFLGITYRFEREGSVSLVSAWMVNGTLRDLFEDHDLEDRLTVAHRLQLLLDVGNGLNYLHSFPYVHGDLSCNNILFDHDYNALLTDFGYTSMVGDVPEVVRYLQMTTVRPGTVRWAAPEHFTDGVEMTQHSTKSDIYSFGNIAFLVLSGKHPWREFKRDEQVMFQLSRGNKPKRPPDRPIDDHHWKFIEHCWSSFDERPSAEDVVCSLQQFLLAFPYRSSIIDMVRGGLAKRECVFASRFRDGAESMPLRPETTVKLEDSNLDDVVRVVTPPRSSTPAPPAGAPTGQAPVSEVSSSSYQDQPVCTPNVLPNVLIVGETGVGKSSVINLIAGQNIADVSSSASGCTMEATSYDFVLADKDCDHYVRIIDTVGLNEPNLSKCGHLIAIEKTNALITELLRTGGICLLFCIRGGMITSVTQSNYRLFRDILCQNQVPVAFVVTGMENEHPMESWWSRNAASFERSNLFCNSHVCVTATPGLNNVYAKQYQASQVAIRRMLLDHMSRTSWKPAERTGFASSFGRHIIELGNKLTYRKQHLPVRSGNNALTVEELARQLEDKCNFAREEAVTLASRIWARRTIET